jgi:hypothetical protein
MQGAFDAKPAAPARSGWGQNPPETYLASAIPT